MASSEPPPVYSATARPSSTPQDAEVQLPEYSFPATFKIGGKYTSGLLVEIPQIKGHLALLNAFASLKDEVEASKQSIPDMPGDMAKRWAWFVGLAVERFDVWCRTLQSKDALQPLEDTLPPLDVLMVWHSYMLNPRWYAEDGQRLLACKPLLELGDVFAKELPRLPAILDAPPTDTRVTFFYKRVSLPFSPFQSARVSVSKDIKCPKCARDFTVPYMTLAGTGYLQQTFSQPCPKSDCLQVTKETLCSRKLAETLSRLGGAPDSYLPGTFFTDSQAANMRMSTSIVSTIRRTYNYDKTEIFPSGFHETLCLKILNDADFSLAKLRALIGPDKLLGRIMSAHSTPMIYSVELAGAVLRQGSFVKKMADLEWTKPGYFDNTDDELALQHAIARYHAFLDLLSSSPASFFVPTLDIDLVWHTHQLCSTKHAADCKTYVGRFIDHDDKVDGVQLSSSFDLTCRAWKNRFGIAYTHCGCPLPGDTIGQRLSRLISSSKSSSGPPSQLVPPADKPALLAATHASEHNAVQFSARNTKALKVERARHREHQERQVRRMKREHAKEEEKVREERERRKGAYDSYYCGYGPAFLLPVPLYYGGAMGGGVECAEAVDVVLVDVGVVGAEAGEEMGVVVAAAVVGAVVGAAEDEGLVESSHCILV